MYESYLPFRRDTYNQSHIRIRHHCGHVVTYRIGADAWPAFRPCHNCAIQMAAYVTRRISPHIRAKSGEWAVAQIIREILDNEYKRQAERNPDDTGEVQLYVAKARA